MDERLNWLISVDDHVVEPPHVWQARVPRKLREHAPRLVTDERGESWLWEGKRYPTAGLSAAAGKKKEEFSPAPLSYTEMREGCYDANARIVDMDRDGVLASLCFPTFPRFAGPLFSETKDRELGLECIKAYNDWMLEEWAGAAPGRFIPMIIVPYWDSNLAATEVERCAARGAKAITFPENPAPLGFPSLHDRARHWDPLFSAASDTAMPLCTHIGSSGVVPSTAADAPFVISSALLVLNAQVALADWLFSGIFVRFPSLKLCLSEGGIGWIPYLLERCDHTLDTQRAWAAAEIVMDTQTGTAHMKPRHEPIEFDPFGTPPSQLFRDHVFGCFIEDIFGSDNIRTVGVSNVMIETDYPHTDSTWPHSIETAHARLKELSDEEKYLVLQGNARRVFNFEPVEPPPA
jgi:predicted TIM-barrel fold metal-dependent hydrolase